MNISVYLACTDGGSVMDAFRTRDGALKCLIENALFDMDDRWTDEERASVISHLEEDGSADGFGYIEYVGELGE